MSYKENVILHKLSDSQWVVLGEKYTEIVSLSIFFNPLTTGVPAARRCIGACAPTQQRTAAGQRTVSGEAQSANFVAAQNLSFLASTYTAVNGLKICILWFLIREPFIVSITCKLISCIRVFKANYSWIPILSISFHYSPQKYAFNLKQMNK